MPLITSPTQPSDTAWVEIVSIPDEESSRAESKSIRFRSTWTIQKFEYNVGYESPIFSPGGNGDFEWRLKLETLCGSLDLFICLLPCNIPEITIKYTISLINASGKTVIRSLSPKTHQAVSPTEPTVFKVMRNFTTLDLIDGMEEVAPGRKLTITCEIQHPDVFNIRANNTGVQVPQSQLLTDIRRLFESEHDHSDVKIICGFTEYNLHRAILAVRSPEFASMLKDRKAEKSRTLVVNDMDDLVFGEMLRYIYTDQVRSIETTANEMLAAATRFRLARLKLLCEESLCAKLTIDNAADNLILANDHNAEELRAHTMEFILDNAMEIMDAPSFKSMSNSHPFLLAAVFKALVVKSSRAERSVSTE